MEESQNALNKERKKMNELKDPEKKKDKRNLQLIHHGLNTKKYNQGPCLKLNRAI